MITIDKLDYDKVIAVAQNMGYDPKIPTMLNKYKKNIQNGSMGHIQNPLLWKRINMKKTKKLNNK